MTILKFVSQDELDDLDDDPRIAFMTLVNHAQRRFAAQTTSLDGNEEIQWHQLEELQHSFMNVIVAAGKRFEIEPFVSMQIPRMADFKNFDYRQFQADLDHYITQLVLDNSIRAKRHSVTILPESKDRIRRYVHELQSCIEKSHVTDSEREALLKKLKEFEAELEKRRLNILSVARVAFELLAVPGGMWASAEVASKLVSNVMQVVADSKSAEHDTRELLPTQPPKALLPPRNEKSTTSVPGRRDSEYMSIDDDIPF